MINGLPTIFGYTASNDAIRSSQDALMGQEFRARASEACAVREVYEGCFAHHVDKALGSRYHEETYKALKMQHGLQTHNRLITDVLDKACVAWSEGADYALIGENGERVDSPEFDAVMLAMGADNLVKQLDVMTELFPAVCVMPVCRVNEEAPDGSAPPRELGFVVLTPEWFNAIPADDDPADLAALEVYEECWDDSGRKRTLEKYVWTATTVTKYEQDQRQRWQQVGPPIAHGYGRIPATLFRRHHPLTSLWADVPGPALAAKTVEANCWETMVSYQGSGQVKFLIGEFKGWPQGQVLRHGGVVDAGSAENINVLDLQTDVAGFVNTYISRLRRDAALMMGLGVDEFDQTGVPPSGESLKMRYWQRDRRAMQKRSYLVESLRDLYACTLAVLAVQLAATQDAEGEPVGPVVNVPGLPPEGTTFTVDPRDVTYPELLAERTARDDWKLSKGLITTVDLMIAENPDLTPELARKKLEENKATQAAIDKAGQPQPVARPGIGSLLQRAAVVKPPMTGPGNGGGSGR